jgi:hypothetical protein
MIKGKYTPAIGGSQVQFSYSGGRIQEVYSSKPARGNSSQDPISHKIFAINVLVEWLKV